MGIFSSKETEKLREALTETEKALAQERALTKKLSEEIEGQSLYIRNLKEEVQNLSDKLHEVSPLSPSDTRISALVKLLGLSFVAASLAFAYILATKEIFPVNLIVIWSAYGITQILGLYLIGYGKKMTCRTLQNLGAYMAAVFLVLCGYMTLSLFGLIQVNIGLNLVGLGLVNALGVAILVFAERKLIRLHHSFR